MSSSIGSILSIKSIIDTDWTGSRCCSIWHKWDDTSSGVLRVAGNERLHIIVNLLFSSNSKEDSFDTITGTVRVSHLNFDLEMTLKGSSILHPPSIVMWTSGALPCLPLSTGAPYILKLHPKDDSLSIVWEDVDDDDGECKYIGIVAGNDNCL